MRVVRLALFGPMIAAGLMGAGCGGDGLPREAITGTVTLDGQPLPSGVVTFMPTDPAAAQAAAQADVEAGAYRIPTDVGPTPGPYRVSISAPVPAESPSGRPAGAAFEAISGTGAEEVAQETPLRESIPARYNAESTLKADVTAGGPNTFDFALESE